MAKQREPIDVLCDLVELVRTPAKLMTTDRFERWSKVINEAEAMVQAHQANHAPPAPTLADLFAGGPAGNVSVEGKS